MGRSVTPFMALLVTSSRDVRAGVDAHLAARHRLVVSLAPTARSLALF